MSDDPARNPFNDTPTVGLLGPDNTHLATLSQREAARLLRAGIAELVFALPPAVRLLIPSEEYEAHVAALDEETTKAQFLHARRSILYGNVRFVNPAGEVMFHADHEKALWYLNRDLVEVSSSSPPVLRFKFSPAGPGHVGDEYYLGHKENRCVVCGADQGLNRHHVVPSVYRRHLPDEVKNHSHHDVLLLCLECHERYETAADELKAELGREHGVPLHGIIAPRDPRKGQAMKAAWALLRHSDKMPPTRREVLFAVLREWLGREEVAQADLQAVAERAIVEEGVEHGSHVIAHTPDVQAFVRRWREHFLRTMQPAHLPTHWDIDRPAARPRKGSEGDE